MEVQFKIKIKGKDEQTITAGLSDVIAWEEEFQKPSSLLSGDTVFARDYVWLAWSAATRLGMTDLDFKDWTVTLDDIESAENEPIPLESPALTGSSPDSPSKPE